MRVSECPSTHEALGQSKIGARGEPGRRRVGGRSATSSHGCLDSTFILSVRLGAKVDGTNQSVDRLDMKTIVFLDAVNFSEELKKHGRPVISIKINQLRDFAEYFFVHRLKGLIVGELGDGFLIFCPPEPHKVIQEAFACMGFIRAYNHEKEPPAILNARIAIHYGLIAPPEGGNYIDSNINLLSRLEGATPPNAICVSSVVHDIVADTLRQFVFTQVNSELKGFGQSRFYFVSVSGNSPSANSLAGDRLSFYLSTIEALRRVANWNAVINTCKQALNDFKGNPEFLFQLGFASSLIRESEDAITAFQECVRQGYNIGESFHFIGTNYRRSGDEPNAIEAFRKAVEYDPQGFHSMVELAEICLSKGQVDEAWDWTSRALKIAPHYFRPIALKVTLVIVSKRRASLENLVRNVPEHNLEQFHSGAAEYLRSAGARNEVKKVTSMLVSVFGANWKRRCALALRVLLERNRKEAARLLQPQVAQLPQTSRTGRLGP